MKNMKKLIPQSIRNIYHLFQAICANIFFAFPSRKIKIIGVTGTNGKTTTVQMITRILEEAGHRVAMASTINFKIAEKEWVNKTKFTTLSSFAIQKFIQDAIKTKCEYLVLETSSHALDQNRVWGVEYDVAVITNVTREHFDYHKNIEKYRRAKEKLFRMASGRKGILVANLTMDRPEDFLGYRAKEKYGYAAKLPIPSFLKSLQSQLQTIMAKEIKLDVDHSKFMVNGQLFKINLPGEFNIENALAAICAGISQNIALETMAEALEKITGVPGRSERVPNEKGLNIIIDYALTPDSLEKFYMLVHRAKKPGAKIIAVFGSCGERDRGKRPIMGKIVAKFSDYAIVTNEDPYHEDPQRIIDEIFRGVVVTNKEKALDKSVHAKHKEEGKNCWRIMDRRVAIAKALKLAEAGDFIIVTGKGAEETMAIGDERIPWNDKKVILEEIKKLP